MNSRAGGPAARRLPPSLPLLHTATFQFHHPLGAASALQPLPQQPLAAACRHGARRPEAAVAEGGGAEGGPGECNSRVAGCGLGTLAERPAAAAAAEQRTDAGNGLLPLPLVAFFETAALQYHVWLLPTN